MNDSAPCILLVDDDLDQLFIMKMILERAGYRVLSENDPRKVMDCYKSESPDCVVLDVMIPGISGKELLQQMAAISDVPIMMITAAEDLDQEEFLKLGASSFCTKPDIHEELLPKLKEICPAKPVPDAATDDN